MEERVGACRFGFVDEVSRSHIGRGGLAMMHH